MPHGMTNRQGFSIHQVKRRTVLELLRGGLEQGPYHSRESVQAGDPLLIRTQARKGRTKIRRHQPISLFETRDPQTALQQSESQYFGIRKTGHVVRRLPPAQQVRMGSQKVIDKDIELCHLIDYARQRSRTRLREEFGHATLLYSGQLGTALFLQLKTGVKRSDTVPHNLTKLPFGLVVPLGNGHVKGIIAGALSGS